MKHNFHLTMVKTAAFMLLLFTLHSQLSTLLAQGTAFTYQGRLDDTGGPANGLYDLKFTLFESPANGDFVGPLTNSAVAVSSGLFTVRLDFVPNVFNGLEDLFLEIGVRAAGGGDFTTLSPRQRVTPSPYAIHAGSATKLFNGAVTRLNNLSDDVTLAAGQNVTITPSGNTLTIGASGINPWQTSGSSIFYNAGNVGIGSANPGARLEINAPVAADGVNLFGPAAAYYLSDSAKIHRASLGYAAFAGAYSTDALPGDSVLRSETGNLLLQNGILASGLAISGNRVGIGTPTPQARLDVRGDIRLGASGQFRAASGEENLRIIRGTINGDGTVFSGAGFTVSRPGTGDYRITFNTPFAGPPSITANATFGAIICNAGGDTNRIGIRTFTTDSPPPDAVNVSFHFIAIGPR